MSDTTNLINIDSSLSKIVLNSIIKNKKIDYESLKILNLKGKIEQLRKEYLKAAKTGNINNNKYKYFVFFLVKNVERYHSILS